MSGRGRGRARGRGAGRGRGRGASGGRGRGGSRGGSRGGRGASRGARRGSSRAHPYSRETSKTDEWGVDSHEAKDESLDIKTDLKKFFVGTASFEQHFDAQEVNKTRYAAGMAVLEYNGVEVNQNARVRALAAAWARKDHELVDSLLVNRESFGMVEVLKAITLLDSARRIREEEKKLKKLQVQTGGKVKSKVLGKFKSNIDNLTAVRPKVGSASGAVCKHVQRWVRKFTREELEFYALHMPTEPWKRLADICHFNPEKDFPELPWFLSFCFGKAAPDGSMVESCREMKAENVNKLLKEFPVPYSHVKEFQSKLTEKSKAHIAARDKLDQIIWYYEDLQCAGVDEILKQRIAEGEKVNLPYGKLMERLLTMKMIREDIPLHSSSYGKKVKRNQNPTKAAFIHDLMPMAQQRLKSIKLTLDTPVVVIGDRSSSMEVAIRTSTIIASLLTAICNAKLVFFDHENMEAPFIPSNIEEILEMAVTIQTRGTTIPAASLYPFYVNKEVIKTFIIVTDEEENGAYKGDRFAPLFKKYREEVSPDCKLVFVSFLTSQHAEGQMIRELHALEVTYNIMQFNFNQQRPDLTKLDKLFGLLSADTEDFEELVQRKEVDITAHGLNSVFDRACNIAEQIKTTASPEKADSTPPSVATAKTSTPAAATPAEPAAVASPPVTAASPHVTAASPPVTAESPPAAAESLPAAAAETPKESKDGETKPGLSYAAAVTKKKEADKPEDGNKSDEDWTPVDWAVTSTDWTNVEPDDWS